VDFLAPVRAFVDWTGVVGRAVIRHGPYRSVRVAVVASEILEPRTAAHGRTTPEVLPLVVRADLGTHLTLWAPGCTLVVCAYVVAISVRT